MSEQFDFKPKEIWDYKYPWIVDTTVNDDKIEWQLFRYLISKDEYVTVRVGTVALEDGIEQVIAEAEEARSMFDTPENRKRLVEPTIGKPFDLV